MFTNAFRLCCIVSKLVDYLINILSVTFFLPINIYIFHVFVEVVLVHIVLDSSRFLGKRKYRAFSSAPLLFPSGVIQKRARDECGPRRGAREKELCLSQYWISGAGLGRGHGHGHAQGHGHRRLSNICTVFLCTVECKPRSQVIGKEIILTHTPLSPTPPHTNKTKKFCPQNIDGSYFSPCPVLLRGLGIYGRGFEVMDLHGFIGV